MALTKEQALTCNELHYGECTLTVGPRGGVTIQQKRVRRNGQTQTWKTRPDEFRMPCKYGLSECLQVTQSDVDVFHAPEDCPLNAE